MYSLQGFVEGGRRDHRVVSEAKLILGGLSKGKRRKRILCALFKVFNDNGALVQRSWRHNVIEPESGYEAFWWNLNQFLGLLVRIDFILKEGSEAMTLHEGNSFTVLRTSLSRQWCKVVTAYLIWYSKIFKCDPCTLNKWTKTTTEECNVFVFAMFNDSV